MANLQYGDSIRLVHFAKIIGGGEAGGSGGLAPPPPVRA